MIPSYKLHKGNNMESLSKIEDNSIHAIVTDAPYGLGKEPNPIELIKAWGGVGFLEIKGGGFMGKHWDSFVPQPAFWKEAFRVLKPGGYVLCFFGTRTFDWGTLAMRLAGFEIRDCIMWVYGNGFPKSLNVVKAGGSKDWDGYGTALKPAYEPICVARKPLAGTVVENITAHECGAINLDGCRIESSDKSKSYAYTGNNGVAMGQASERLSKNGGGSGNKLGRFPANIIFDEDAANLLDMQTGHLKAAGSVPSKDINKVHKPILKGLGQKEFSSHNDSGGASRFFYCAKASKADRNYGVTDFAEKELPHSTRDQCETCGGYLLKSENRDSSCNCEDPVRSGRKASGNVHPTVKPISLMRYLVRLVKAPFETCTILDPFMGSGTTGIACMLEGINFIGCEMEDDSYSIAEQRILHAQTHFSREAKQSKQIQFL